MRAAADIERALATPVPEHVIASLLRDPDVARGFEARSREHARRRSREGDTVVRVSGSPLGAVPLGGAPAREAPRSSPVLEQELAARLEATRRNKR